MQKFSSSSSSIKTKHISAKNRIYFPFDQIKFILNNDNRISEKPRSKIVATLNVAGCKLFITSNK